MGSKGELVGRGGAVGGGDAHDRDAAVAVGVEGGAAGFSYQLAVGSVEIPPLRVSASAP